MHVIDSLGNVGISCGDNLPLRVVVRFMEQDAKGRLKNVTARNFNDSDRAFFGIRSIEGETLIKKELPIKLYDDGCVIDIPLTSEETAAIRDGIHSWDVRFTAQGALMTLYEYPRIFEAKEVSVDV